MKLDSKACRPKISSPWHPCSAKTIHGSGSREANRFCVFEVMIVIRSRDTLVGVEGIVIFEGGILMQ
ncbi:hypothetical protein DICVIV_03056 [Dictyocaulus viviparus]|uniref:Uncharacterized protein n=1 Tax=Dictyocaulus viviparus TaxID=29172 RepID=A0A0D8Y8A7_DICVI|nr:hypothetical protein DICVIV_03056 [Dictyocaulus viviparus]